MEIALDREIDLVGIGTSTLDRLYLVEEFPVGDCVHVPLAYVEMGGGPTATALCAAAALGGNTCMIDRIGDRPPSGLVIDGYRRHGVGIEQLIIERGTTTGHASILVRRCDGARAITCQPGTASELGAEEADLEVVKRASILHMNGRHPALAMRAIAVAQASGTVVSFDGGASRFRPESRALFESADILIVSEHFAEIATGAHSHDAMLSELAATGARIVGITRGEAGSEFLLSDSGERFSQPAAHAARVVDTTGCGDIFHGAFLYHLSRGQHPATCAERAALIAARNCEGLGGRFAIERPDREASPPEPTNADHPLPRP